jgi:hypothetical protein
MRTTIDIPDETYRAIRVRAASEGTTMREIVLDGVAMRLGMGTGGAAPRQGGRPRFPVIRSKKPGSLKLGEEGVYEYIPFP